MQTIESHAPLAAAQVAVEQAPARAVALRSVRDLYYVLFRRFRYMLLVFVGVFLPVAIGVVLQPPSYRSEARLMVRLGRQTVTLDPTVATGKIVGVQQSRLNEINSELEILRSHDLLMEVVAATYGKRLSEVELQEAAHDLKKRLEISVQEESSVIALAYTDSDRQVAQTIVGHLIHLYLAKHIAVHRTEGSYEFFLEQTQQAAAKIVGYEERLRDLRKQAGAASIEDERRGLAERLGARESALEDLRTELAAASGRASEDPVLARLREKLNELRVRELELLTTYEENSTAVVDLRSQVAEVAALLAEQEAQGVGRSTATVVAQIRTVEEQVNALRARVTALDDAELAITRLERELAMERESYARYSESLEQARIDQALNAEQISNIGIVQPATLPARSNGPSRWILVGLALVLAGACALLTAFALEYFDDSIDTAENAQARLAVPVLATLRDERARRGSSAQGELTELCELLREWNATRKRPFGRTNGNGKGNGHPRHLEPGVLRVQPGGAPAVIGVTSSTPGNGVSTVTARLGVRLSRLGSRTLLVSATTDRYAIQHYETNSNRSVMRIQLDLSVLRDSTRMDAALWKLRAKSSDFDFVLIDLPDLNSSSAVAPLAALCDGVLLVVGANRTRWQVALHAKERLLEVHANLLGTIVNRRDYPIPKWLYETL